MHIKLEVLASTNIKRKKPWPHLAWLGQEKESLFLMDNRRLSVLYVPSGKTKRKVPKVHPHLENATVLATSPNGQFLVGLQHSGNLFIWHRDKDLIRTIQGLPDLATHVVVKTKDSKEPDTPKPLVFVSDDGCKILVVIGHSRLFLWEIDSPSSLYVFIPKQGEVKGTWSHIGPERDTKLPTAHTKETSIDATFFTDSVLGYCCLCSYVFNNGNKLQITSVLLRWLEAVDIKTKSKETFTVEWNSFQTPIEGIVRGCRPIFSRGALASCHAHNGLTLAVAVNQRSPHNNRIVFVSLLSSMAQVSELKGSGTKAPNPPPKLARTYWISDMKWTSDDLFLVCITKMGSVVLLTRLGEPIRIESQGCSVELGPDFFLPFHPLITVTTKKDRITEIEQRLDQPSPTNSVMSDTGDIMKQRFSVSTHPSLPMFLCSDGYLVTVVQLPEDTSCTNLMKTLLAEVRLKLNKVSEQCNLKGMLIPTLKFDHMMQSLPREQRRVRYEFETPADTMGMSTGSSMSPSEFQGFDQLDEGKLFFGGADEGVSYDENSKLSRTGDSLGTMREKDVTTSKLLHSAQSSLLAAWSLGVSHSDMWTRHLDKIMTITVDSMVKLCELMVKTDHSRKMSGKDSMDAKDLLQRIHKLVATSPDTYKILIMLRQALGVLKWDTVHQYASTYAFQLIIGVVQTLLQSDSSQSYSDVLTCCYHILLYSEKTLNAIYSWFPKAKPVDGLTPEMEFHLSDQIEGALFSIEVKQGKKISPEEQDEFDLDVQLSARSQRGSISARSLRDSLQEVREGLDIQKIEAENVVSVKHTPAKRLMLSWKMLYKQLLYYHNKVNTKLTKAVETGSVLDSQLVLKRQKVVLLLSATQMKLNDLGFNVVEDMRWKTPMNRMFLKGTMYYEASHYARAIDIWRELAFDVAEVPAEPLNQIMETQSLLAVLYTQLQQYNLMGSLQLIDSLIECYTELPSGGQRSQKQLRLGRSDASFLSVFTNMLGNQDTIPVLPFVNRPGVRPIVQCLARFMAFYFSNKPLYVYPPHAAMPLPQLHVKHVDHACRVIPLYHEAVSYSIRQQDLSEIWTSDRALQLLLIAGLLPEAIWFSKELGDWKSAFVLGVTHIKYSQLSAQRGHDTGHTFEALPAELHPLAIMKSSLEYLIDATVPGGVPWKSDDKDEMKPGGVLQPPSPGPLKRSLSAASLASMGSFNVEEDGNIEQLSKTVTDMLTAATISGLDATPWLLGKLIGRCQSLVSDLQGLVPEGLYLPAPPLYCPQPATASAARVKAFGTSAQNKLYQIKYEETADVIQERQSRHDIANTIQLLLLVLNASNCTLPCLKWYVEELMHVQDTELTATRDGDVSFIVEVPPTLAAHTKYGVDLIQSIKGSPLSSVSIAEILNCFRDLCSLTWLLHVRDKFCTCARKYQTSREKSTEFKPHDTLEFQETLDLLLETLKWGLCLLPFIQYLDMEAELQDMVLTLISELPATKNTANILAEHFYHPDVITPAVEDKYQRLMDVMKTTLIPATTRDASSDVEDGRQSKKGKRKLPPQPEPLATHFIKKCEEKQIDVESMSKRYGDMERQVFSSKVPRSRLLIPRVGNREFEHSELFLEFLDTFFLVSFNKQTSALTNGSDLKNHLPLLVPFSDDIKKQELSSVSHKVMRSLHQRHGTSGQSPAQLPRSQSFQEISPRTKQDFIEIRKANQDSRSPSLKRHERGLFRSHSYSESLVQRSGPPVLQVVHRRYGSQGSIVPEKGIKKSESGDSLRGLSVKKHPSYESLPDVINLRRDFLRRRSSSLSDIPTGGSGSDVFIHAGLSQGFNPYANINVNLDPRYNDVSQLMEWLTRWSGKHHVMTPKRHGSVSSGVDSSGSALRVHLPLQLVHNCLWLNDNKYLSPIAESEREYIKRSPVILEEDGEITISPEDGRTVKAKKKSKDKKRTKTKEKSTKKKKKGQKGGKKNVQITETAHIIGECEVGSTRRQLDYGLHARNESPSMLRSPAPTDITDDITAVSPLPSPLTTRTDVMMRSVTPDETTSRGTPLFSEPLDSQVEPLKLSFTSQRSSASTPQSATADDDLSASTSSLSVSSFNEEELKESTASEPEKDMDTIEPMPRRCSHSAGSASGDVKKMIRVELRKIMQAQHQNILHLLDSSGTVDLDKHGIDPRTLSQQSYIDDSVSDSPVRDRSRKKTSKGSHYHDRDTQAAPMQSNADTQTGQTLKLLGEQNIPRVTVYPPDMEPPTRDVPYFDHSQPYYPTDVHPMSQHFIPDGYTPRDGSYSQRSFHEPILEHGMPLLRLPPEAQAHLRMPRARPYLPREAWITQPDESKSGKDFFNRPELKRYQDEVQARQELDKYSTEYGKVQGNLQGKKFFSVAEESQQTHEREHIKDREEELRAKITKAAQTSKQHEHGVPLLKLEPGHGYVPSRLFSHYYKVNDEEQVHFPPVDSHTDGPSVPKPDHPHQPNGHGFPLLHMNGDFHKPVQGHGGNGYYGMPKLIPPELIINYEQEKYHKELSKYRGLYKHNIQSTHARDWQSKLAFGPSIDVSDKSRKEYYVNPDDMGPVQLLHVDINPFEPEGDRNNITRRRRRRQKEKAGKSVKINESDSRSESTSKAKKTKSKKEGEVSEEEYLEEDKGYVIPQGMYDSELQEKRDISIYPTSAEIHLKAVNNKDAKPRRHDVKLDVATSMETNGLEGVKNVRFAEPTTQGKNIQEQAISQYADAATGISEAGQIIAPDIFFNLRFNKASDQPEQSQQQPAPDSGRAYINVVDIDTSVLNSIPKKEEKVKIKAPSQTQKTTDEVEPSIPELHYNALRDRDVPSTMSPIPGQGPDSLTVSILDGGMRADRVDMLPRVRMSQVERDRSKHKMSEKLIEMNDQLNAIDTMARNMEREFKDTKVLLHTVDRMTDAIVPEGDERPRTYYSSRESPPAAGGTAEDRRTSPVPDARDMGDVDITARPTKRESGEEFTPDDSLEVKKGKVKRPVSGRLPEHGDGSPRVTDRKAENLLHISGLSGVSDIIAEVIAEGDVDTSELGITEQQKEAAKQHMQDRQEEELWEYTRLSNEELRNIFYPSSKKSKEEEEEAVFASLQPSRRSMEEREELHKWMSKRKTKQMEDYKSKIQELRQSEREPYQPPKEDDFNKPTTWKEMKKADDSRSSLKRTREGDNVQERIKEAYKLMGDIVSDKPELPRQPAPVSTARSQRSHGTTSVRTKGKPKDAEREKVQKARSLLYSEAARLADEKKHHSLHRGFAEDDRTIVRPEEYLSIRDSFERDRQHGIPRSTYRIGDQRPVGRHPYLPERSGEIKRSTDTDSTGIATAYTRQLEKQLALEIDKSATLERITERSENKENEPVEKKERLMKEEVYEYKPKPYTQIVKVQRPELTRKAQKSPRAVKTYSERLADMKMTSPPRKTSESLKSKERLYGTKRIPGTPKTSTPSSTRVVKTYTERLAEMKQDGEAVTKQYRQQHRAARRQQQQQQRAVNTATMPIEIDRMSQLTARGMKSEGTPRSSVPYTERLQELSNAGIYRGREGRVSPTPAVGVHYKERSKSPSTYVDRLQTSKGPSVRHKTAYVGPPRTFLRSPTSQLGPPSRSFIKSPTRQSQRLRPYADPYRPMTAEDILDEVSEISAESQWTVPDEIRQLLGKDDTAFTAASEYSGMSLDYIDGDDYTSAVDIRQLEEIASVGSESIISDIDWSAIEKMVADVK
ncbi:uncharacterized protein LOC144436484 [Glandiceps talaboti]